MAKIVLDSPEDVLEIEVRRLASRGDDVIRVLLSVVESVNQREVASGLSPSIVLRLILSKYHCYERGGMDNSLLRLPLRSDRGAWR
jgi:hypothetical protein